MAKLKLNPEPTFKAKVAIPVPGAKSADVEFTFRHRTREAFSEWLVSLDNKEKVEAVMDVALGWDLDDPFNEATVAQLLSSYIGAFQPILDKYMDELVQAKQKN